MNEAISVQVNAVQCHFRHSTVGQFQCGGFMNEEMKQQLRLKCRIIYVCVMQTVKSLINVTG